MVTWNEQRAKVGPQGYGQWLDSTKQNTASPQEEATSSTPQAKAAQKQLKVQLTWTNAISQMNACTQH
jgi:hypothetical protein